MGAIWLQFDSELQRKLTCCTSQQSSLSAAVQHVPLSPQRHLRARPSEGLCSQNLHVTVIAMDLLVHDPASTMDKVGATTASRSLRGFSGPFSLLPPGSQWPQAQAGHNSPPSLAIPGAGLHGSASDRRGQLRPTRPKTPGEASFLAPPPRGRPTAAAAARGRVQGRFNGQGRRRFNGRSRSCARAPSAGPAAARAVARQAVLPWLPAPPPPGLPDRKPPPRAL